MTKGKTAKQMERHFKGLANHYRIQILILLDSKPNLNLNEIVEELDANEKTIGEHTRRLVRAGLINKRRVERFVEHKLSPYGEMFVGFLKEFKKK